jgi:hypothetical protein
MAIIAMVGGAYLFTVSTVFLLIINNSLLINSCLNHLATENEKQSCVLVNKCILITLLYVIERTTANTLWSTLGFINCVIVFLICCECGLRYLVQEKGVCANREHMRRQGWREKEHHTK